MPFIPPITSAEFFHHLQRCIPPVGWPSKIAVANSGGPDSIALLFLLTTAIREHFGVGKDIPSAAGLLEHLRSRPQILSIHVNHDLQSAASVMEKTAMSAAERLNVSSVAQKIQWGTPSFPAKPCEGSIGEKMARDARYNVLFTAMQQEKANIIAFGHHADDQVETIIMRMTQGSSSRGLAGMRPVRRWGMGNRDNEFGAQGMRTWIMRPLLPVSKDRILATCEANGLDYVHDPTNFQPGLTIRNAVRHVLSANGTVQQVAPVAFENAPDITSHIDELRAMAPDARPADQLREAVRLFGIRLEEVEMQVTNVLARARRRSPPSTLLLTTPGLAEARSNEVRTALIRRCLRYASHGPWGSLWAEAGGERETLRRVAQELWAPPSLHRERRTFTAGAGVNAIPVVIIPKKSAIRYRPVINEGEVEGWIFMRAPHYQRAIPISDASDLDVTDALMNTIWRHSGTYSTLYDNRFEVEFDLGRIPRAVWKELSIRGARLRIEADGKWALPKVVLGGERTTPRVISRFLWYLDGWDNTCTQPAQFQSWIKLNFVRSLETI